MANVDAVYSLNRRTFTCAFLAALAASRIRSANAAPTGVLNAVAEQQPTSLDPLAGNNGGDFRFLNLIYESLVDWDPDTLRPVPRLAADWKLSSSAMIINLRPGVVFHDGTPFDAVAAKFNLDRCKTDPKSNFKNDLASVDSIEITGPMQITLKLNQPNAALPAILSERAGLMVSPTAFAKSGDGFSRNPVGTGPFFLQDWKDGDLLVFKRNEKYWNSDIPKVAQINYRVILDASAALRSVLAGENHIISHVSPSQKVVVDRNDKVHSSLSNAQALFTLWVNSARKPLDDVRVRKALSLAIDRQAYSRATSGGLAEPAKGLFPSEHWAYDKSNDQYYGFDRDAAKALLKEAGLGAGFEMSMMGPNDDRSRQRQEFVAQQLSQVGIKVQIKGLSVNDAIKSYFVDKTADTLLILFGGRPDPSVTLRDLFAKNTFLNASKSEPDGFSEAIAASVATEDLAGRKAALARVQKIVAENALMVPLAFDPSYVVMTKSVAGYRKNLFGRIRFDTVTI